MSPPDDSTLLARLDERTRGIAEDISEMKEASKLYVTRAEFTTVRALVYGSVTVVLLGFMAAVLKMAAGW